MRSPNISYIIDYLYMRGVRKKNYTIFVINIQPVRHNYTYGF